MPLDFVLVNLLSLTARKVEDHISVDLLERSAARQLQSNKLTQLSCQTL